MKVAIVGLAWDGRDTEWRDGSWAIWGLNGGHRHPDLFWGAQPNSSRKVMLADRWFQIHPPFACDKSELDWLEHLNAGDVDVPTYVLPEFMAYWEDRYPKAAARGRLLNFPVGYIRRDYPQAWLANTFALEVALALHQGAHTIGLFGVECATYGRELAVERPCIAWWMGYAASRGVRVITDTTLGYEPIYGVDYWAEAHAAAAATERVLPDSRRYTHENLDSTADVLAAMSRKVH